jgi:hypothetical protein
MKEKKVQAGRGASRGDPGVSGCNSQTGWSSVGGAAKAFGGFGHVVLSADGVGGFHGDLAGWSGLGLLSPGEAVVDERHRDGHGEGRGRSG